MGGDVKISVIATGFDPARPLKRIEQPIYRRAVEPRPAERQPVAAGVAASTNGGTDKTEERRYDPNDLEVPSFLRRR